VGLRTRCDVDRDLDRDRDPDLDLDRDLDRDLAHVSEVAPALSLWPKRRVRASE
jgi:hypothetical protein